MLLQNKSNSTLHFKIIFNNVKMHINVMLSEMRYIRKKNIKLYLQFLLYSFICICKQIYIWKWINQNILSGDYRWFFFLVTVFLIYRYYLFNNKQTFQHQTYINSKECYVLDYIKRKNLHIKTLTNLSNHKVHHNYLNFDYF